MNLFTLMLIALSLSMDAFAIAVCNGIVYGESKRNALFAAVAFGLAQGIMPLIGYFAGSRFYDIISDYDHWIAFILLVFIGGRMLYSGIKEFNHIYIDVFTGVLTIKMIVIQAIATSIDALAVGISFAALDVDIYLAAILIAATTFICSYLGSKLGQKWGVFFKRWSTIAGGAILCLLGIKIIFEHLGIM